MIAILFVIAFTLLFYLNFRKTFVASFVCFPLLMQYSFPIDALENLYVVISLVGLSYFFVFCQEMIVPLKKIPMFKCFVLLTGSMFFTFVFHPKAPGAILRNLIYFLDIYILFCLNSANRKEIIGYFSFYVLLFGSIVGIYSLFETLTEVNPYIEIVNWLDLYTNDVIVEEIRYGFKRSQSLFSMHTTNACVLMFSACYLLCQYQNGKNKKDLIKVIIAVVCGISLFFTGTRSGILGFMISLLMFAEFKLSWLKVAIPLMIVFVFSWGYIGDYITDIFNSFIDTEQVAGSSDDMRSNQFATSFLLMMNSPIFGNGMQYTWEVAEKLNLFGAESLWFPLMIDQGIVGVLSCLIFFIGCFYYAYQRRCSNLIFFVLGFLVFNTMSSIPKVPFPFVFAYLYMMAGLINVNNGKHGQLNLLKYLIILRINPSKIKEIH